MSFLQPSDFVGIIEQSTNKHTDPKIQAYIDRFEPIYLRDLLGTSLYDLFVADLLPTPAQPTSVPQTAIYTSIFDAFNDDDGNTNGLQHISEGMVQMLKFFVFFEYANDNQYDFSITGATKNTYSNAEIASINVTNAIDNYNQGVKTYRQIQWFICENDTDYPLYNGKAKQDMSWL
jgi:hypothetical protein